MEAGDVMEQSRKPILLYINYGSYGLNGTIQSITEGEYTVEEAVATISDENGAEKQIGLMQNWPVRVGRPYKEKKAPFMPLITGQRVIDTLFPIAKGGVAAVPGLSVQERRWFSINWPNGLKLISLYI